MPLRALIVCSDPKLLQAVVPACDTARIDTDVCTDPAMAIQQLKSRKYEALVVECEGDKAGVLRQARRAALNRSCISFAIIHQSTSVAQAYEMGANFVLEKPLSQEQFVEILRVAQGLMISERRRYFRVPLETVTWLSFSGSEGIASNSKNISQAGMCLESPVAFPVKTAITARFQLPESPTHFQISSEVAWSDEDGRIGLRFLRIPAGHEAELSAWLNAQREKTEPPQPFLRA